MFDTLRMYTQVIISKEQFEALIPSYTVDMRERIDSDTGELTFSCTVKKHKIHYISYYSSSGILTVELSVPRYLYGDNVYMITTHDEIERFWRNLKQDIFELFGLHITKDDWICKRIDCCYNLNIENTGFVMGEWLDFFAEEKIPYKKNKTIHFNEMTSKKTGVTFKANSQSQEKVMFYSKHDEVCAKQGHYPADAKERAKNLLRVEVCTSRHERKRFSDSKKMIAFLNIEFFQHMMTRYKINERLQKKSQQSRSDMPHEWLLQHFSTTQLETILGHIKIKEALKESAKSAYTKSTWSNRERLLNAFDLKMTEYRQIQRQLISIDFHALNSSYMQAS